MPNIMLDDIMQQFNIGAATFGQFSGIYYIGYTALHLPIGIMLDRFGPKKVMPLCILLTVVGLMPLLMSDYWVYPIMGRFLIGVGSSAAILGVFKIIRMTFNESLFPRMLTFSVMIGLIGAIYGGGPVSYMKEAIGYHSVVEIMAAAGVLLAIVTYFIIPEIRFEKDSTVFSDLKEVFGNKKVVLSCIFAGLMVGPLEGFADVWGTAFLKQVYGIEGSVAASLPSMIFIGMCFGAPVLSFIADKMGSYVGTIVGAGLVMAASFIAFMNFELSNVAISVVFVMIGVCCSYQILAIYKASTYVREGVAGLTTAVANMIIMVFGYFFHTVMGQIINAMGGANSPTAIEYGISVIPVALIVASIGFTSILVADRKGIMVNA
jgi:predicted MFS family arabinose efflux permease